MNTRRFLIPRDSISLSPHPSLRRTMFILRPYSNLLGGLIMCLVYVYATYSVYVVVGASDKRREYYCKV